LRCEYNLSLYVDPFTDGLTTWKIYGTDGLLPRSWYSVRAEYFCRICYSIAVTSGEEYIWPTLVIWGFDRFLRGLKLILFNAHYYLNSHRSIENDASVEILSPRFLRVTLVASDFFRWQAGQSVYLNIPSVSSWRCEFHPFTIGSIRSKAIYDDVSSTEDVDSKSVSTQVEQPRSSKKLTFYIRVHSGFTARLREAAQQQSKMRVILDGPYSAPPRLHGYASIVLISGASCLLP
jgi:ferric-chelate reductase